MTAALVLPLENDSAVSRECGKERERERERRERKEEKEEEEEEEGYITNLHRLD